MKIQWLRNIPFSSFHTRLTQYPGLCPIRSAFVLINKWLFIVAKLYVILCNPMDCSPARLLCPWISQARILKWVAIYLKYFRCVISLKMFLSYNW